MTSITCWVWPCIVWCAISGIIIKGSFYNQEKLPDELDHDRKGSEQAEMSASRRKIQLQETAEAEEIDEEKWTKLKGRSIVLAFVKEM